MYVLLTAMPWNHAQKSFNVDKYLDNSGNKLKKPSDKKSKH